MSKACECDICRAAKLSKELGRYVHPWELMYGVDSLYSYYIRTRPGLHIWQYDNLVPQDMRHKAKAPQE